MSAALPSSPELLLFERIRRGERQALAELYDLYAPALLGMILRTVGERHAAEDVLQATFVKIWELAGTFDPSKERLFTWMLHISRGLTTKAVPASTNKPVSEIRPATDSVSTHNKLLTPDGSHQYQALDLVFTRGYCFSKAADALGCTVDVLKSRIRMELQQLRGATIDE